METYDSPEELIQVIYARLLGRGSSSPELNEMMRAHITDAIGDSTVWPDRTIMQKLVKERRYYSELYQTVV